MIAFGCDHGGVELKDYLVGYLRARGGGRFAILAPTGASRSIIPTSAGRFPSCVSEGQAERGVLVCTSGIGMSIIANKFPGVRAALVHDLDGARSSREHNDANILVLSGAKTDAALARQIIETWLATPFGGGRHQRRIDKISQTESDLGMRLAGAEARQEIEPRK